MRSRSFLFRALMPYLSFDSEYCELRFGANLLGGRGEGSVLLSVLAALPPMALILVSGDGRTTIRRLPSRFPIRVDGEILGSASMELLDNSHLEVGEHRLIFNLAVDTPAANGAHDVTSASSSPTAGGDGPAERRSGRFPRSTLTTSRHGCCGRCAPVASSACRGRECSSAGARIVTSWSRDAACRAGMRSSSPTRRASRSPT